MQPPLISDRTARHGNHAAKHLDNIWSRVMAQNKTLEDDGMRLDKEPGTPRQYGVHLTARAWSQLVLWTQFQIFASGKNTWTYYSNCGRMIKFGISEALCYEPRRLRIRNKSIPKLGTNFIFIYQGENFGVFHSGVTKIA